MDYNNCLQHLPKRRFFFRSQGCPLTSADRLRNFYFSMRRDTTCPFITRLPFSVGEFPHYPTLKAVEDSWSFRFCFRIF